MRICSLLVLCIGVLVANPVRTSAQALTHYVKYETAGRVAWGLLEGETIRELQGNVFEGAKPNWSYCVFFRSSPRMSCAACTSLYFASASLSPGLRSGWYFFDSLR